MKYCKSMEEAELIIEKELSDWTERLTGTPIQTVFIGKVPVKPKEYLDYMNNVTLCKDPQCRSALTYQMIMESSVLEQAVKSDLPADESTYGAMIVECVNGYIGLLLCCPSAKSLLDNQYLPIIVTVNGEGYSDLQPISASTDFIRKEPSRKSSDSHKCLVVDKTTGKSKEMSMETLFEALNETRDKILNGKRWNEKTSLLGKVKQKEHYFDIEEFKQMVDATFASASAGDMEAWYPNQYALGIAFNEDSNVKGQLAYFASNFQLGLRYGAERAAGKDKKPELFDEVLHLEQRLNTADCLDHLSEQDCWDIQAYVRNHPLLEKAANWYRRNAA